MEKMLENDEYEIVGVKLLELMKLKEKIVGVEGVEYKSINLIINLKN